MKKLWLILKFWQWGAIHSPQFNRFIITLDHFPIELKIHWSKWTRDLLTISLSFYIPKIIVYTPHAAEREFVNTMKNQGIEVDHLFLDGIPF